MFITIEGPEYSGKTTQLNALHQYLSGIPNFPEIVVTREPGGTEFGRLLRELLPYGPTMTPTAELLLFAADRAQHVEQVIWPALNRGALVLCDRYVDSTVAYQGYGRGLDLGRIWALQEVATTGLMPSLTLYMRLPVKAAMARGKERREIDRIEAEWLAFHQRVAEGYEAIADANPERVVPVPAGMPVAMVTRFCIDVIKERYAALFG